MKYLASQSGFVYEVQSFGRETWTVFCRIRKGEICSFRADGYGFPVFKDRAEVESALRKYAEEHGWHKLEERNVH